MIARFILEMGSFIIGKHLSDFDVSELGGADVAHQLSIGTVVIMTKDMLGQVAGMRETRIREERDFTALVIVKAGILNLVIGGIRFFICGLTDDFDLNHFATFRCVV